MKQLNLYLQPYQEKFLETIYGSPIILTGRYNVTELIFSLLSKNEYIDNNLKKITVNTADWVFEKNNGKKYLSKIGTKIFSDYVNSLIDIELYKFLAPYHKNPSLKIKDGLNLFIEKFNLPNSLTFYERLKKKDFRRRTKKNIENPAVFFDDLSSI